MGARAVGPRVGEQKPLGKSPLRGNPSPESTYLPTSCLVVAAFSPTPFPFVSRAFRRRRPVPCFFFFLVRPRCLRLSLVSGPGCSALRALSSRLCFLPGRWLLPRGCCPPPPPLCLAVFVAAAWCSVFFFFPLVVRPRCLRLSLVSGPGCSGPRRCVLFALLASRFSALRALSPLLCFSPGRWLFSGGCCPPPPPPFVSRGFRRRRSVLCAPCCAVLCVPGCGAAPHCGALCRPVLCCCLLCCLVALVVAPLLVVPRPVVLPVALGPCALRRCVLRCSPALCALCCVCFVVACWCAMLLAAVRCAVCPGVLCCALPVLPALCGAVLRCAGALALCCSCGA